MTFLEQPLVSLAVGTLIGVVGIVLSVIFYKRSQYKARMTYVKVEVVILGVNNSSWESDLDIKYQGVPVPRLTAGRTGFWNSGNTTINYDQVIQSDPLRICAPEGEKLLVCHASVVSRSVLGVRTENIDERSQRIVFDFLDPGDGFVLHTAQSSPAEALSIEGTIKGIPKGVEQQFVKSRFWSIVAETSLLPVLAIMFGLSFARWIGDSLISYFHYDQDSEAAGWINGGSFATAVLLALVAAMLPYLATRRRANRIPAAILRDPVLATSFGRKVTDKL